MFENRSGSQLQKIEGYIYNAEHSEKKVVFRLDFKKFSTTPKKEDNPQIMEK